MKITLLVIFLHSSLFVWSQDIIDPTKLPLVNYNPTISGINSQNQISIDSLFSKGIKVILADRSFKVIQFDIVFDCHSRSLFDFSVKRYQGDKVDGRDEYLRKRVLAGDVLDISNTVIEKNGVRLRMKDFGFLVTR